MRARPPARSTAAMLSVHGVGLDVLVEERRRGLEPQPAQPARVATIGIEEVISNSARWPTNPAAPATVQPHQRHQVHRRERHARDAVQLRAVGRVEPRRVHRVREQLRVDAVRAPAAVLVGLDLHQRASARPTGARSPRSGDRPPSAGSRSDAPGTRAPARAWRRARCTSNSDAAVVGLLDGAQGQIHRLGRDVGILLGRPSASKSPASKIASSEARNASSDGSHSQRSSTRSKPR